MAAVNGFTKVLTSASILAGGLLSVDSEAHELIMKDIRLGYELLPTEFSFDQRNNATESSGDSSFDTAWGISLGYIGSLASPGADLGFIYAGEVVSRNQGFSDGSTNNGYGFRISGGMGWIMNDRLTLSAEPFIGYGISTLEIASSASQNGFSADGTFLEFGFRLQANLAMTPNWQLFGGAGYLFTGFDITDGPDAYSAELEAGGLYFVLGVGYRFSTAPARLE